MMPFMNFSIKGKASLHSWFDGPIMEQERPSGFFISGFNQAQCSSVYLGCTN